MRKLKLLLATLILLVGGGNFVLADTSLLTTTNGWTKITALPDNLSDYYFAIVDNSQDLMLTLSRGLDGNQGTDFNALFYGTSADPLVDKSKLFALEKDGDNIIITNVENNVFFLQTEYNCPWNYRTHDNGGGNKSWGHVKFTYTDSYWTIQNAKIAVDNGNYLGMWQDASPANGKDLALNKSADAKGTFQIYAILRTTANSYYEALRVGATLGAAPSKPVDMTGLIVNPNARFWKDSKPFGWTTTGTQNINNGAGYDGFPGIFEYSDWGASNWTGSLKQTISVPNGKYQLKAAFMAAEGVTVHLTANSDTSTDLEPIGDTGGNINADGTETTMGSGQRGYKYLTLETTVTTGSLELGTYAEASKEHLWVNADNFTLSYLDPCISVVANEMAVTGGEMTADQWYKFTITVDDEYHFTPYANIIISDNANQLLSTSTGEALTATKNLTAGTYYVRSTTNQTLTIAPNTLTYNVGDVTATSIADNTYLQELTTVTFTLGGASTSDGTATLALQGTPTAVLNNGTSNVATGELTLNTETQVITATFDYNLVAGTTYTITLPAGAVAWDKNTTNKNSEKVITFNTPAVFDGHYYIKKNDADLYFSRGGEENKQAVLDAFGIPVKITTDDANVSRVKFVDTGLLLGASGSSYMLWTDKGTGNTKQINWTIAKNGDNFKFYLNEMDDDTKKGMNIDGTIAPKTDTEANAYAWALELPAAHPAKLQAVKDAQASTVATAMGYDGITTQAQMATYLATNCGETSIEITGTGGSTKEAYQKSASTTTGNEYVVFVEETVSGLAPGLYRLRVYGFERIAGAADVYNAGGAAGLAYVYATSNSETQKVKLASLFDYSADTPWQSGNDVTFGGKYYPNGMAGSQAAFNADNYANDVYVQVVNEGEGTGSIKFGIKQPNCYYEGQSAHNNSQWICYNNFSLVRFDAKPTAQEKQALADAITAAEAKVLGFESGEYAPYNNVAALEALAAAKAIDPESASGAGVVDATTALTNATWTANTTDVEAVFNGSFSSDIKDDWGLTGWTRTNGWGQQRDDVPGETYGYYNQPGSLKYGDTGLYTMPLKANTIYTLKFKYASWEDNSNNGLTVSVLNGEDGMAAMAFEKNGTKYTNGLLAKELVFVTGAAGNYVLTLANSGNTVMSGVSIKKAESQVLEFADGTVPSYAPGTYPQVKIARTMTKGKWVTAIYPFALTIPSIISEYVEIALLDSYDNGMLNFTNSSSNTANKPFLMRVKEETSDFYFNMVKNGITTPSAVAVVAAEAEDVTTGAASLKGVYEETTVEAGDGVTNYVLSNNIIYKVGAYAAIIDPYRAYIQLSQPAGARLIFSIDGNETTAIDGIETVESENGNIYNLQGQRVQKAQKGIYIVNGKKVLK